jgi:hypothetical protein
MGIAVCYTLRPDRPGLIADEKLLVPYMLMNERRSTA